MQRIAIISGCVFASIIASSTTNPVSAGPQYFAVRICEPASRPEICDDPRAKCVDPMIGTRLVCRWEKRWIGCRFNSNCGQVGNGLTLHMYCAKFPHDYKSYEVFVRSLGSTC